MLKNSTFIFGKMYFLLVLMNWKNGVMTDW